MKKIVLSITSVLKTFLLYSLETVATAGGNLTSNGTISYTIGQLITTSNTSNNITVSQGIQQSIKLFTLVNTDLKTPTSKAIIYPNDPTKDKIVNVSSVQEFCMFKSS
jgi:hypothetical protein